MAPHVDFFGSPAEATEPVLAPARLSQVIHNRRGSVVKVRFFLKRYQHCLASNFDEFLGKAFVVSLRDFVVSQVEGELQGRLGGSYSRFKCISLSSQCDELLFVHFDDRAPVVLITGKFGG